MTKKSTRYTEEFKQQIVDLYNSKTKTVSSLSSEYGVSTVTIYKLNGARHLTYFNLLTY